MATRERAKPRPDVTPTAPQRIGDLFYATRVLRGRGWSLRRFAPELGIDHVFLSLIEKGERYPSEELVARLAELRGEDPRHLLAMLCRERMVRVLTRELRRGLLGAASEEGREAASPATSFAVLSRAASALPDSGEPVAASAWRKEIRNALRAEAGKARTSDVDFVVSSLATKGVVQLDGNRVRKKARHFTASGAEEQIDLATDFAWVFAKSLTDKVIRHGGETYLRNHFLNLAPERSKEFHERLDDAITQVLAEFDAGEDEAGEFTRIVVAGTSKR